ncbi:helix-turn-helix transcriptional regulator [Ktedonospora formicarum]|uniref:HTH deoR-type domain-containing protein n=1 Tax=Ktedonospora formicarum TaxID=2778364 RepID=A0A8J3I1V9_9CHLR|nr:WYL domain-containing protein [Ktedonospora formicarum]GHO43969.1 hypothetical protein KSX_21320 [Ktedonospora formicarum]
MRADRLLTILMLLQTRGRMTARELAERLEVSERTIYRDMEALSMAGIPVYAERGPGGGCQLLGDYKTTLNGLNSTEIQALFTALDSSSLVDLGMAQALHDARLKLMTALPVPDCELAQHTRQRVHVDHRSWFASASHSEHHLPLIQQALYEDHILHIQYHMDDGALVKRLIAPYGLVSKAGTWFLIGAHCEISVIAVATMQCVEMTEKTFIYPQDFDLEHYWENYCQRLEDEMPPYARPLHLSPYEARQLPRMLSEWGYILEETDASPNMAPASYRREKKAYVGSPQRKKVIYRAPQHTRPLRNGIRAPLQRRHGPVTRDTPAIAAANKKKQFRQPHSASDSRTKKKNGFKNNFNIRTAHKRAGSEKKNAVFPMNLWYTDSKSKHTTSLIAA